MAFQKQSLSICPNCGNDRLVTIESRKSQDSTRRRKRCDSCGHRITTHEITAEFFEQAKQSLLMIQQLHKVLNVTTTEIKLQESKCDNCQYNKGSCCEYGFPEYNTPESSDCNWHNQ
jgi:ribosomal protein L32